MTILERKSKATLNLVKSGEYSPSYALMVAEELNDNGKLLDVDYEEVASYVEDLLNKEIASEKEDKQDDVIPYELVNNQDL